MCITPLLEKECIEPYRVPSRRLRPRMSTRCAMDGHQRNVERKRSVVCRMITDPKKNLTGRTDIPLFFPVRSSDLLPVNIPKQVSNLRSTLHLLRQSEECSAQDVQAVRSIRPPSFITQLTSPQTANAVRYGTAKGEWFLNAVRNSETTLQRLIPSRHRPLSSHRAKSSKHAADHVNHPQGLTRQSCSSERRVL